MSTHNIPFLNIKRILPELSQICNYGICSKGPKNEFEPAVVNEPSVFEPLKFYCSSFNIGFCGCTMFQDCQNAEDYSIRKQKSAL